MRTYLDCYPCCLRQALEAARIAGADEGQQQTVIKQVLDELQRVDLAETPPEIGARIHRIVRQELGIRDPYLEAKEASTREALALYPRLKAMLAEASDPIDLAIRLSIAGNIIDFGPHSKYDLWEAVESAIAQDFALDDRVFLRSLLSQVDWMLYLADNAGETVFDRLLIETLNVPVVYAVKGGPVLNDATEQDAVAAGLCDVATVTNTGTDAPGTILSSCSEEFQQLFNRADLIIAKGQANYETLSESKAPVFFLLRTKCEVIARDVGVPINSIVVKQGGRTSRNRFDGALW